MYNVRHAMKSTKNALDEAAVHLFFFVGFTFAQLIDSGLYNIIELLFFHIFNNYCKISRKRDY